MIEKKTDKGNLENKRTLFLLLGFVVVLGLVYAGFELFASEDKAPGFTISDDDFIEVKDEDVIATDQTPPPPPEPQQQQQAVVLNIVEDNIKVSTDFDFGQDVFEDDVVEEFDDVVEVVEDESETAPPVYFTEEMPEYPGGMEALNSFLSKEIQYPEVARNNGITGTVLVEFVVERDGRVSNAKVKVPLYPDCDKEAVRGIMAMPKWKPGKNMGKPVRCFYQVPVTFRM
ncbi:MAG: energy transducer TonB [Bacteroidales bacterium]|jgi:protein TonB|nr:energy transducer TonB [Bacteroidales bacterium]